MNRLDFKLPDWTRVAWASSSAREVWEPRVQAVSRAWVETELLSVVAGVRRSCLRHAAPSELLPLTDWAADRDLTVVPLAMESAIKGTYSSESSAPEPGGDFLYRVAVTRDPKAWPGAWKTGDIGGLLGFPECCQRFFEEVWTRGRGVDTTWQWAGGTGHEVEVDPRPEANILLRWLGVRLVPHLPCSTDCRGTIELGVQMEAVARAAGYGQEMDWAREMLSWPVEWSALHGIAEIKTPVLKVSTRTDATADKYVVRRPGTPPAEAATGKDFPYSPRRAQPMPWQDNGFSTMNAQREAHEVLLAAVGDLDLAGGAVLDLGCGNGDLVSRIAAKVDATPFGVESDAERAARAQERHPEGLFTPGNLFDADIEGADLVVLMPGRLAENPERAAEMARKLQGKTVLVYVYGDWKKRGLGDLCRSVGLGWSLVRESKGQTADAAVINAGEMD